MVARHCTAGARTLAQVRHAVSGPSRRTAIKDLSSRALSVAAVGRPTIQHPPQTRSRYSISRSPGYEQRPPVIPCSDSDVVDYFRKLLPPLEFPDEVALRMVTHTSWRDGLFGHNNRQSFIGRRVLNAYLMTFFHAHTPLTPTPPLTKPPSEPSPDLKISSLPSPNDTIEQDFNNLANLVLHTRTLGEHVGGAWELERVMRWIPNADHHSDPKDIRADEGASSGFHKIRGTTVEAVVGGVFYQFGGVAAHRLFHTRLLPHVSSLLPREYRQPAQDACDFLGGPSAPLLLSSQQPQPRAENVSSNAASASG